MAKTSKAATAALPDSIINALLPAAQILKLVQELRGLHDTASRVMGRVVREESTVAVGRAFVALYRIESELEAVHKSYSKLLEEYKTQHIPELLELEGQTNIPLVEGFRVGTSIRTMVTIRPDRKAEAYAWLREHGLEDIVTETVNAQTLSGAARESMVEGNVDFPPGLFNLNYLPSTSVTAPGGK